MDETRNDVSIFNAAIIDYNAVGEDTDGVKSQWGVNGCYHRFQRNRQTKKLIE